MYVQMQGLTSLRLEHLPHLLQFPAMPEGLPAALWRLPPCLRCLSLAGSCPHPAKLKLLGAACGSSVAYLDIGTGGGAIAAAAAAPPPSTGTCPRSRAWPCRSA